MRGSAIKIRKWETGDIPLLKEMADKQQHFFTDPRDNRNHLTFVAEDGEGRIIASLTGRITAEIMLNANQDNKGPLKTATAIIKLWEALRSSLWEFGIADVHMPVKPGLEGFKRWMIESHGATDDTRLKVVYDIRKYMVEGGK